jgi:putative transposase
MDKTAKKTPHAVYVINYHLVWIPRYRKKVLIGRIAERLKELLSEIASQYRFQIVAVEVMLRHICRDHVHLFVSAPPKFARAEIVRLFKGITSRRLMHEFAYLRRQYWGEKATLWAESYYVGTAGHVSVETIQRYIENQKG